jgi:hypothetical protein
MRYIDPDGMAPIEPNGGVTFDGYLSAEDIEKATVHSDEKGSNKNSNNSDRVENKGKEKEKKAEVSGGFSIGVQAGFDISNTVKLDLNLASTPILKFDSGKETIDYPTAQKDGITIEQSAEIGAGGFGASAATNFVGQNSGHIPGESSFTITTPLVFPAISQYTEWRTSDGGESYSRSMGTMFSLSISFIIKAELKVKIPY